MSRQPIRRRVKAAEVKAWPQSVWNAFIDLLAMESIEDLTPVQRRAHLVFWYESEVQNGGHGQYFENQGLELLQETCEALLSLGLPCHAKVLSRAAAEAARAPGTPWEDWSSEVEIEELDNDFHRCQPTLNQGLERHLAEHTTEYVEII